MECSKNELFQALTQLVRVITFALLVHLVQAGITAFINLLRLYLQLVSLNGLI